MGSRIMDYETAEEIRRKVEQEGWTVDRIAYDYGISNRRASRIIKGIVWGSPDYVSKGPGASPRPERIEAAKKRAEGRLKRQAKKEAEAQGEQPNFLRYLNSFNAALVDLGLPPLEAQSRAGVASTYKMHQGDWKSDQPFSVVLMHFVTGTVHLGIEAPDLPLKAKAKRRVNHAQMALQQVHLEEDLFTVDLGVPYPSRARTHVMAYIRTLFERLQKYQEVARPLPE